MLNRILSFLVFIIVSLLLAIMVHSCANIAAPMGGEYDVNPPVVRNSTPSFNALNVSPQRVEIEFDENIKIESPTEKVIITPPQRNMPIIRSAGRRAIVELKDELLPNTTYTIDFTDAIVDNNEANPLENFMFSFSTGDQLDTLSIAGRVLNAEDLEPVTGMYVGIHSNFDDTVFTNVPFERISRTDSRGNFIVRGMAPGKYRVFALGDLNRDYKYDNPMEAIAFLDSIVMPSIMPAVRQDTVFVDSITVDTILDIKYTRFLPDDLVLNSFLSGFQRLYLLRNERSVENKLNIFFSAPTDAPGFSLIEPKIEGDGWYVAERNLNNDTLMLWITDSVVYQHDSIRMQISYMETDTLNRNVITNDTLSFNFRRTNQDKEAEENKREKREEGDGESELPEIRFLNVQSNMQSTFELFNPIRIEFEQPVIAFDSSFVKLEKEVDSLYEVIPFRFETDSLNPRMFVLRPSWEPGGKYKFSIDSAAVTSIYGLWNNTFEQSFTVKDLDQYGNLQISISGLVEGKKAFVQLLNNSDKPFRKSDVKGNVVRFQDLPPGEVYARLIIDDNGDGFWTTGNYEELRQPEKVYYYPGKFVIRAYSDHLEEWNLNSVPEIKQKPIEITINKPQEKKRRNLNEERQQQQQQQNQQSSPMQGLGGGMRGMR
ncbi:MAG: Ig-like domain-containing protein [Fermentimonas sp.]|nr:Ig-like domain-containing protein [Fermentimonas sp.]